MRNKENNKQVVKLVMGMFKNEEFDKKGEVAHQK